MSSVYFIFYALKLPSQSRMEDVERNIDEKFYICAERYFQSRIIANHLRWILMNKIISSKFSNSPWFWLCSACVVSFQPNKELSKYNLAFSSFVYYKSELKNAIRWSVRITSIFIFGLTSIKGGWNNFGFFHIIITVNFFQLGSHSKIMK